MFRKSNIFSSLVMFLCIMAFDSWVASVPNRSDGPTRAAGIRFIPVKFDPARFAPLRLAGAWRVVVDDPRFGGISALAVDRGELLALTDSGTLIRFPKPGGVARAIVRDLPAGPGSPRFKSNRDSEALARDPAGRGWWVAFEHSHQLWLYDPGFRRRLDRIDFGRDRWRANKGIETMVADGRGLILFPEMGSEVVRVRDGRPYRQRLFGRFGYISDGVRIAGGRSLLVTRKFGLAGIEKRLVTVEWRRGAPRLRSLARLDLGPLDNVEAIAVEPLDGATRLWLMTDNDFRGSARTLLVALDLSRGN